MSPVARRTPLLLLFVTPLLPMAPGRAQQPAPAAVVTPQEQNALRAAAYKAENEGRFGAAADRFLKLSRAAPERVDYLVAAGRCLGRSGRFGEAIDLLDAGRRRFDGSLEVAAMLARTLLLRAEREAGIVHPEVLWADAAEIAEGVLQLDPDHLDCRLLLAQAEFLLGDWARATAEAEEAARRHPDHPGAHVLLGRIAMETMARLLQRHAAERPTGAAEANLVAEISAERRRAHTAFTRAAALDPTRAHPHVALSQLASLDHKDDEARRHLLDALAIDPEVSADHDRLTQGMDWQARRDLYRDLRER
ncbi:MAG TPA: tetratricopeptide repeat protein, partial [bacterium]|nr:tetratricopeptide repeat protein [bacterium]